MDMWTKIWMCWNRMIFLRGGGVYSRRGGGEDFLKVVWVLSVANTFFCIEIQLSNGRNNSDSCFWTDVVQLWVVILIVRVRECYSPLIQIFGKFFGYNWNEFRIIWLSHPINVWNYIFCRLLKHSNEKEQVSIKYATWDYRNCFQEMSKWVDFYISCVLKNVS